MNTEKREFASTANARVLSITADRDGMRRARRTLRSFLADHGVPDRHVDDAALVMAELAENAHTACDGEAPVTIVLAVAPGLVVVAVTNERGDSQPDVVLPTVQMPAPAAHRGRGLPLVAMLSTRLAVHQQSNMTTVRAELCW